MGTNLLDQFFSFGFNIALVLVIFILAYWGRDPLRRLLDDLGIKKVGISSEGLTLDRFEKQMAQVYEERLKKPASLNDRLRIRNIRRYLAPIVSGRRVLWVDDNHTGNVQEHRAFLDMSIEVQDCRSTDEAMRMLIEDVRGFDLVISDWTRPKEKTKESSAGLELLKRMREDPRISLPVIFYHGLVDEKELENRRSQSKEKGGGGTTGSPGQLLQWTIAELVHAALYDEKAEFYQMTE